jgi:hypothetical protein
MSVLFSEPRGGTFELTRQWIDGDVPPSSVVTVVSALTATGMIACLVAARLRLWLQRQFEPDDRLVVVFFAVVAANAAICYLYTKDEIMSTAGAFYALAAFAAARWTLARLAASPRGALATAALAIALFAGSAAWAIRAAGLHYHLYSTAFYVRNEWPRVDEWLREQHVEPDTAAGARMVADLRDEALEYPVLNLHFLPSWTERWFR